MQQEVERVQIGQLEPVDAVHHALEMAGDTRHRHLAHEERIVLGVEGDEADVRGVALVARAGVRQVAELERAGGGGALAPGGGLGHGHASRISTRTCGSISRRSISAGQ